MTREPNPGILWPGMVALAGAVALQIGSKEIEDIHVLAALLRHSPGVVEWGATEAGAPEAKEIQQC